MVLPVHTGSTNIYVYIPRKAYSPPYFSPNSLPLPSLLKGGRMRFLKNGCNGGKPGMRGELALKWGDGKFVKSLYIVGRGVLTSYFMKIPLVFPNPPPPHPTPFSNFDHPSSPCPILTSNSYTHGLFCCPVSLDEWVITPHVMYYFT